MRAESPDYDRMLSSCVWNSNLSARKAAHISRFLLLASSFYGFVVASTILAIETDVADSRTPKSAAQALWYGVLASIEQTAVLVIHRNLVPDVWNDGRLNMISFGINTFLWYWMSHYDALRSDKVAETFISICRGLAVVFAIFGLPSLIMSRGRRLNIFDCGRHKCLWLFVFPISIAFFIAALGTTTTGTDAHYVGAIFCVIFTLVMAVAVIFWDRVIHDEVGYTVIASVTCIYSMQGIGKTAAQVQMASRRVNGYMGMIIPITFVKLLYFVITTFVEEILFNVHTASKESKYPPVFAMQLSEDLVIGTLYLEESLSSEFATSLIFLTFLNFVRDAGWIAEIYCRHLKGITDEKEVALYMGDKYFQVQQNFVAEFIALSCIFVLVLTEYLLDGVRSPLFTADLSRSNREELLMVYAASIVVRIPTIYAAWKIFKERLKWLREVSNLAPTKLTDNIQTTKNTDHIVDTPKSGEVAFLELTVPRKEVGVPRHLSSSFASALESDHKFKINPLVSKHNSNSHLDTPNRNEKSLSYPLESKAQTTPFSIDGRHFSEKTNATEDPSPNHMLCRGKIVNDLMQRGHFTRATISYWERNKMMLVLLAITSVLSLRFYVVDSWQGE